MQRASLVDQGWAEQSEVARAFGYSARTVRRHQRRFERGGLAALGRARHYPRGRPRLAAARQALVTRWRSEGVAGREIARRLGVSEKAVWKQLRRLGFGPAPAEQLALPALPGADPKLSDTAALETRAARDVARTALDLPAPTTTAGADPKLSAAAFSLDRDARDRRFSARITARSSAPWRRPRPPRSPPLFF